VRIRIRELIRLHAAALQTRHLTDALAARGGVP
jgi:hypothetical protein